MIFDCVSSLMIALLLKEHTHEIYSQLMLSLSRNRICKHEDRSKRKTFNSHTACGKYLNTEQHICYVCWYILLCADILFLDMRGGY